MTKIYLSTILSFFFLVIFIMVALLSFEFLPFARYLPLGLAMAGIILSTTNIFVEIRKIIAYKKSGALPDFEATRSDLETPVRHNIKVATKNFGWLTSFFLLVYLIGFKVGALLFITSFLMKKTDFNWIKITISAVLTYIFLVSFEEFMNLVFPQGILQIPFIG